ECERNKGIAASFAAQYGHMNLIDFLHQRGTDFSKDPGNPIAYNYILLYIFEKAVNADDDDMLEQLYTLTPKEKWPDNLYAFALEADSEACLKVIYQYQIKGEEKVSNAEINALESACYWNNIDEIRKLLTIGVKPQPIKEQKDKFNSQRYEH